MKLPGIKINSGYAPRSGPIGMRWEFTISPTASVLKDFYQEMSELDIEFIQTVWVENHANPNPLFLAFQGLGQILKVPANTQGIFPVLAPAPFSVLASVTTGVEVPVACVFLNMPMPFYSSFSAL